MNNQQWTNRCCRGFAGGGGDTGGVVINGTKEQGGIPGGDFSPQFPAHLTLVYMAEVVEVHIDQPQIRRSWIQL